MVDSNGDDNDYNYIPKDETIADFARSLKMQVVRRSQMSTVVFDQESLPLDLGTRKLYSPFQNYGN